MTARSGMTYLIEELRGLSDAGTGDFTAGTTTYWSDDVLQDYLDRHRTDFIEQELYPVQQNRNGTAYYLDYRSEYGNIETVASGTSVFKLDNAAGTNIGTSLWSADYRRGVITFASDTSGSSMFLTGRRYDMNAAAADVWRTKAGYAAKMYDFSAGGQSFRRSQYKQYCIEMAQYYEGMSGPTVVDIYRGDNISYGDQ